MAQWRTKQQLDEAAVDYSAVQKDEQEQTVSDRFVNIQTQRLTNPTKEIEQEKEERLAQKRAGYEEALAEAAYREEIFERQEAVFAAERAASIDELKNQPARKQGQLNEKVTQAIAIAQNTPLALWMTAWHTWAWLTFQLPLGILGVILLALAAAAQETWLTRQFASLLSLVSLGPMDFYMLVHVMLWGLSFLGLLVTMFVYKFRGQSPLFGDKSIAKIFAVLGAIIGYAIPLLNIFPWIGIYIFVMWTSRD